MEASEIRGQPHGPQPDSALLNPGYARYIAIVVA
jgi:hypothetical protein